MTFEPITGTSPFVAIVTAGQRTPHETEHAVRATLRRAGCQVEQRSREMHRATYTMVGFSVRGREATQIRAAVDGLSAPGIDVIVMPGECRRGCLGLIVSDVDSTFIEEEVIELLADAAGSGRAVREITDRAMHGELDFAASLRERVATLAGLPVSAIDEVAAQVHLTPGAAALARAATTGEVTLALVSGGFHEVVDRIAAQHGIRLVAANRLQVADGRLTGQTLGPVIDRAAKAAALQRFALELEVATTNVIAVGDGANDLDMMASAGFAVAFDAKPMVRAAAPAALTVRDLGVLADLTGLPYAPC